MAKAKFTIKKFDGDDPYSWAVFYAEEVRGKRSPIMYGEARPVISGLARQEAMGRKKRLEERYAK